MTTLLDDWRCPEAGLGLFGVLAADVVSLLGRRGAVISWNIKRGSLMMPLISTPPNQLFSVK